ncbi:MAG: glycosyltransferase family 4 protein [Acidobacteriota bacterium]
MKEIRLLILTPNPVESASTRYRIAQYLPSLASAGITGTIAPFISTELFQEIYRPGLTARKLVKLLDAIRQRFQILLTSGDYEAVFISREIMTLGPPLLEWLFAKVARLPLIFDFDDATWVPYSSPTYGNLVKLIKPPSKTSQIIGYSSAVIAGNGHLAAYASQYNPRVTIIPTVVDPTLFHPHPRQTAPRNLPVVGWIGSHSTAQYLRLIMPALASVGRRHPFIFRVIGAGREISLEGVIVENRSWHMEREFADFCDLDIGVYPIIADEWSAGKCAFKAIQYQAAGVACVASAVGMNREVIDSGRNGILVEDEEEWMTALEYLLTRPDIRRQMGEVGRESVIRHYSLQVHAPRMVEVIQRVVGQRARRPA